MKLFKEGDKLLCSKTFNNSKIGTHYNIDCKFLDFININGIWFSSTLSNPIYPYVYDYFFTEQEERKIKLQIIKLQSKI